MMGLLSKQEVYKKRSADTGWCKWPFFIFWIITANSLLLKKIKSPAVLAHCSLGGLCFHNIVCAVSMWMDGTNTAMGFNPHICFLLSPFWERSSFTPQWGSSLPLQLRNCSWKSLLQWLEWALLPAVHRDSNHPPVSATCQHCPSPASCKSAFALCYSL